MRKLLCVLPVVLAAFGSFVPDAAAVDPNPLTSAYWRLEEGPAGSKVPANAPANPQTTIPNTVIDAYSVPGATNHLEAYNTDTAPLYTSSTPPAPLRSGLPNTLAWQLNGNAAFGQDVNVTDLAHPTNNDGLIKNGVIGGWYDPDRETGSADGPEIQNTAVTGFTLEAAFNVASTSARRVIIAKEGRPGLALGNPDPAINSLPTLALQVLGPEAGPNQGKLQIELFDASGALRSVSSIDPVNTNQWYYAAVVNDGATLSLYLASFHDFGYELQGSTALTLGALYQGNFNDANWKYNWPIGRGAYGGIPSGTPANFFNGMLDEIRLTNRALDPTEFLFIPEPGAFGLAALAILGGIGQSIRRRRRA